ncbi:hypothetical protein FA95DRAFT_1578585 [Auriscalpium vulgare]|uniref:Uncharacterized protein n=1 Tax=Auriscalpium vulgare TaxID=40419 RepID=A0ACB8R126_9AGAM|nr:hypothetical protein FA95DRAFT_1578585 [Auriscalpium vulgare]
MDGYRKVEGDKMKVAKFYNSLTRLWILRYKYEKAIDGDLEEDSPDPDISLLDEISDHEGETEEESQQRLSVPKVVHKRISGWYQYNLKKIGNLPAPSVASHEETFLELVQVVIKQPRHENILHVFTEMYAELIEPEYAKEWAMAVALAGQGAKRLPKAVENETAGDRKQVIDTRYEKAMADYQRTYIDAPRTREQKEWALNSVFSILQPMVDMVSSRFGVAATLMMAVPMPSKGGKVDVLR